MTGKGAGSAWELPRGAKQMRCTGREGGGLAKSRSRPDGRLQPRWRKRDLTFSPPRERMHMDFDNRAPVPEAAQPTFNDDVPMGAPPIPPDCAAKAFPYLTAADAIRRRRCAPVGEGFTPEGEIDEVDLEELGPWPDEDDEDDEVPTGVRNKMLGQRGEDAACRFLHRRGYFILERNWSCFAGEADIICLCGNDLVFVEVKTRRDESKGFPAEAVSRKKRERYERIAACYLKQCDLIDVGVRFDIVSILAIGRSRAFIRHHIAAFQTA